MKGKSKFASLLMAGIIASSCVYPIGGNVWATENVKTVADNVMFSASEVKIIGVETLTQGTSFEIEIIADASTLFTESKIVNDIDTVKVTGDVDGSKVKLVSVEPVLLENSSDTYYGAKIRVSGLVYNGSGDKIGISIQQNGTWGDSKTFTLDVPKASAGDALVFVNPQTINVVAGETQQITLTVKNNSKMKSEADELNIKIKDDKTTSKGIKVKKSKYDIPTMDPNTTKQFTITLDIDKDTTRGIHEMEVKVGSTVHTVKLKVDSNFMPPSLEVSVSNTSAFEQNVAKSIQVAIKNVGHVAAKNVKVEIVPNEKVFVADGSNVKYVENIDSGKTQTIPVSLIVGDTTSFNLPVEMKLSYIDDLGETQTSSQVVYLSTKGSVAQKELELSTTAEPQGIKQIGDVFTVGFKVTAPDEAKNVKLSVKSTDGIVSKSKSMFIEPKFTKGQTKSYIVDFVATQSVTTGTYPIEIIAEYTLNGKEVAIKQYATVSIDNQEETEEEKGKGKPKVIVGTYSSNPVVVKAGEEFELEIGFLNTHQDKTVKNLKANLTVKEQGENDTGSVFTPVNASNTFFISELTPGQMDVKNIRLYTIPSAKPKTYDITLEMEYEDANGEAITATEHFGIPVEQVTKLEVAEVQVETVEVGMPAELTATIYNTGKTSISNVRIKTIGEGFEVQDNSLIIGQLDKGNSKTYNPTIIPLQGGALTGQIQIEYEDVTGQIQTYTHDFQMDVMESMMPPDDFNPMPDDMMPPMEDEKPAKWPTILGMILGMGIAAGITAFVMKKRQRKLEEMDLDED